LGKEKCHKVIGIGETPISKQISFEKDFKRKGTEYRKICRKNELPLQGGTAYRYLIPNETIRKEDIVVHCTLWLNIPCFWDNLFHENQELINMQDKLN